MSDPLGRAPTVPAPYRVRMSVFGDFVKLRREELNLDQSDLARALGVNQQTVSKWEQAQTVPRPHRIREIAEVLRVDVSDLMKYAGYLPEGEPEEVQAEGPLHQHLRLLRHLTNDQLIVLMTSLGNVPVPRRLQRGTSASRQREHSRGLKVCLSTGGYETHL